jgi:hypothetical protein
MNRTNKLSDGERAKSCATVIAYVDHLERVQRLPMATRLEYYKLAYRAYKILRKHKLLGRREGGFCPAAYEEIRQMLSANLNGYGTAED